MMTQLNENDYATQESIHKAATIVMFTYFGLTADGVSIMLSHGGEVLIRKSKKHGNDEPESYFAAEKLAVAFFAGAEAVKYYGRVHQVKVDTGDLDLLADEAVEECFDELAEAWGVAEEKSEFSKRLRSVAACLVKHPYLSSVIEELAAAIANSPPVSIEECYTAAQRALLEN